MTARERLEMLLDEGSFQEIDALVEHRCRDFDMDKNVIPGDGVVTGHGTINGREIFAFAQDFTVYGGSRRDARSENLQGTRYGIEDRSASHWAKRQRRGQNPRRVTSLGSYAEIFFRNVRASGVVPQISVIMGPAAEGAIYSQQLLTL